MQPRDDRRKTYRRADDLYRKSIEELKDYAIFMINENGIVVNWNLGAQRILGYKEEEVVGAKAEIFFTPEDRAANVPEREMNQAIVQGRAEDERWHMRRDKSRFWASGVMSRVNDDSGKLVGFTKIMRDLTESRRLERERDQLFSLSVDMLCIVRLDGFFERVNPAFLKALGYSEQELLSKPIFELLHDDDKEGTKLEYVKLRLGEPTRNLENRFRCKDGSFRWIAWSYFPVAEQGVAYGVGRDTTEVRLMHEALKQRAAELEQANQVKNEFLATLSHELRTPLTSILGWSRMLRSGRLSEQDNRKALEVVERNAMTQSRLIEDLLDVSRIITGKLRIELQPVSLASITDDVVNELRPSAEAKGIQVNANIDASAGPVMGDPNRLQQIVTNLLSNAIKFTNDGGRIDVDLQRGESQALLQIRDTGIGIPPSVLPHIFEQFRQADSSDKRSHSGLGLGLAIVKHLVAQQKGTVQARSEGRGLGSTFTVEFPLASISLTSSSSDPVDLFSNDLEPIFESADSLGSSSTTLDGIHVLLVEDESDTRELLRKVLEESGARVTAVQSSSEALEAIMKEVPDVLVSDIGMAKETGYELIKKIRAMNMEAGGAVPAVALTAYAGISDRRQALVAGFHVHLAKPVEPDELIAVIRSLVRSNPER
jgi:PAS domain S-box-containing protein